MFKKYLFLAIILFNQTASPFAIYIANKLRENERKYPGYRMNKQFEQLQKKENIPAIHTQVDNPLAYKIAGSVFFGTIGALAGTTLANFAPDDYRPHVFGGCVATGVAFGWNYCKYSYVPAVERKPSKAQWTTTLLNEHINRRELVKLGIVAGIGTFAAPFHRSFEPIVLH